MEPTKKLEETVDLMLSDNWEDRLKAEFYQLEYRYIKLNEMLMNWDLGKLEYAPKGNRFMYQERLNNMRMYLVNLKNLAEEEGIKL